MKIILKDKREIELYNFDESNIVIEDTLENITANVYPYITDDNLSKFVISDALDVAYEYYKTDRTMIITPSETEGLVKATFPIYPLSETEVEIIKLREAIAGNGTLTIIFANISSLPQTIYNTGVTKDMVVTGKEFSNPDATISNFEVILADGSVTISGLISGTTNITLYLTK